MKEKKLLEGQTFNRLTVISNKTKRKHNKKHWLCRCICGNEKYIEQWAMLNGKILSCGCYNREKLLKHGNSKRGKITPEYRAWANMKDRCENPNHKNYKDYGERGIVVCERWSQSFENFLSDMGERPSSRHSLDRHPNPDGSYELSNCRWATILQQNRNKGAGNNTILKFNGQEKCLSEWVESTGLTRNAISGRLRKGWSIERALTTPLKVYAQ